MLPLMTVVWLLTLGAIGPDSRDWSRLDGPGPSWVNRSAWHGDGASQSKTDPQVKAIAEAVAEELKDSGTFRFGLSVGWRTILSPDERRLRDVAIAPDGRLLVDRTDGSSVILSGVVAAYPFDETSRWNRLGFLANINLADFSSESVGVFNKSIEGGLGLGVRLNADFAVALTAERVFSRKLRDGVDLTKPLLDDAGKPLSALDTADARYFKDDNITALSLKFVFMF